MTATSAGRVVRPIAPASALLATIALLAALPLRGGAATVASLSARASAIAGSVEEDQLQLSAIGARYVGETSALVDARGREAAAEAGAATDHRRVAADRRAVRDSAIAAYVEAGATSPLALYLTTGSNTAATGSTYLNAANGQLTGKISALANDEHRLHSLSATAHRQEVAVSGALTQLDLDRRSALSTLAAERHALSSARGKLAALVAARAAAAALASERAAAARAAAAAASAASSVTVHGAGPPAVTAVLASAGTPLPAGSITDALPRIRACEAGGNYALDTGNGYYGAYQFSASTWAGLGGSGVASAASPAAQDAAALRLYQQEGFAAWPECAAILGL